jgi:hypothetical protein
MPRNVKKGLGLLACAVACIGTQVWGLEGFIIGESLLWGGVGIGYLLVGFSDVCI